MLTTYREFLKTLTVDQLNKLTGELKAGTICKGHFAERGNGEQILHGCAFAAPYVGEPYRHYADTTLPAIKAALGESAFWACVVEFDKMPLESSIPILLEWAAAELATR